jgi:hypothetical protein
VFSPVGKRLFHRTATQDNVEPTPAPGVVLNTDRDIADAFREAKLAEEAAYALTNAMSNEGANDELLELAQTRGNAAAINKYKAMIADNQRALLDTENSLLVASKRLNAYPPDVLRSALDKLEEDVSRSGIGVRNRIVDLLRKYVVQVNQEDTRIPPELRTELKKLQLSQ